MMMQRRGMGDYDKVGDWSWLYYPQPYAFANPDRIQPASNFYAPAQTMGLGGCGCGCSGGGSCGSKYGGLSDGDDGSSNLLGLAAIVAAAGAVWYLNKHWK